MFYGLINPWSEPKTLKNSALISDKTKLSRSTCIYFWFDFNFKRNSLQTRNSENIPIMELLCLRATRVFQSKTNILTILQTRCLGIMFNMLIARTPPNDYDTGLRNTAKQYILTLYVLNFYRGNKTYIYILWHFSTLTWHS